MSDPGTSYRSRDEIQEVRQTRDPITSFREKITSAGLVTSEELKVRICKAILINCSLNKIFFKQNLELQLRTEVDDATKKSKIEKEISMEELTTDIYSNPENVNGIRNVLPATELQHRTLGRAVNL